MYAIFSILNFFIEVIDVEEGFKVCADQNDATLK